MSFQKGRGRIAPFGTAPEGAWKNRPLRHHDLPRSHTAPYGPDDTVGAPVGVGGRIAPLGAGTSQVKTRGVEESLSWRFRSETMEESPPWTTSEETGVWKNRTPGDMLFHHRFLSWNCRFSQILHAGSVKTQCFALLVLHFRGMEESPHWRFRSESVEESPHGL